MRNRNRVEEVEHIVYEYVDADGNTAAVDDLADNKGMLAASAIEVETRGEKEIKARPIGQELDDPLLTPDQINTALHRQGFRGYNAAEVVEELGKYTRTTLHEYVAELNASKLVAQFTDMERFAYAVDEHLGMGYVPQYKTLWGNVWTGTMLGAKAVVNGITYTQCRWSAYLGCDNAYSGVWVWRE